MNDIKYQIIEEAYSIVKRKEYLTKNEERFIEECVTNPYGVTLDSLITRKKIEKLSKEIEEKIKMHQKLHNFHYDEHGNFIPYRKEEL